jgi:Ca-activated chloride channel family protein
MEFGWPLGLLALLALPALATAYLWQLRRRRRQAVRFSSIALVRAAAPPPARWRRHAPVALLLASLALLGLAGARPEVRAAVPVSSSAVILAIDVSGSMCSTDVDPNRLAAAQDAMRAFIRAQEDGARIGLVVFSGFAQLAVAPTTDRDALLQAVNSLTTGRGTTIGAAILKSIDAIAEINPAVRPVDTAAPDPPPGTGVAPVAPVPEIVVLLTDGANTRGVTPQDAAKQAAARGVRVYPIGFGTQNPAPMVCTSQQLGGNLFEGFGGGGSLGGVGRGGRSFLRVDEGALRTVARTTGGEYFKASDAGQLQTVLHDLPKHVQVQERDLDVSVGFAAAGALLLIAALGAAARWTGFPS